jgi:hypothetical protein
VNKWYFGIIILYVKGRFSICHLKGQYPTFFCIDFKKSRSAILLFKYIKKRRSQSRTESRPLTLDLDMLERSGWGLNC